jgi:hypothetical protein
MVWNYADMDQWAARARLQAQAFILAWFGGSVVLAMSYMGCLVFAVLVLDIGGIEEAPWLLVAPAAPALPGLAAIALRRHRRRALLLPSHPTTPWVVCGVAAASITAFAIAFLGTAYLATLAQWFLLLGLGFGLPLLSQLVLRSGHHPLLPPTHMTLGITGFLALAWLLAFSLCPFGLPFWAAILLPIVAIAIVASLQDVLGYRLRGHVTAGRHSDARALMAHPLAPLAPVPLRTKALIRAGQLDEARGLIAHLSPLAPTAALQCLHAQIVLIDILQRRPDAQAGAERAIQACPTSGVPYALAMWSDLTQGRTSELGRLHDRVRQWFDRPVPMAHLTSPAGMWFGQFVDAPCTGLMEAASLIEQDPSAARDKAMAFANDLKDSDPSGTSLQLLWAARVLATLGDDVGPLRERALELDPDGIGGHGEAWQS